MEQLFTSLYLDEDVDLLVADLVRARGFSALTTHQVGRLTSDDPSQLAYAVEHGMAILTHNRADFERLWTQYLEAGHTHFGIIIARQRSPYDLVDRVVRLLHELTAEDAENQLRYI